RILATWSGVADLPRTALAASPGSTSVAAKTSIETTRSVAIPVSTRTITNQTSVRRGRDGGRATAGPGAGEAAIYDLRPVRLRPSPQPYPADVCPLFSQKLR